MSLLNTDVLRAPKERQEQANSEKKATELKEKPVIGFFANKVENALAMNEADGKTGVADTIKGVFNVATLGAVGYIKDDLIDKEIDTSKLDKSMTKSEKIDLLKTQYASTPKLESESKNDTSETKVSNRETDLIDEKEDDNELGDEPSL